MPLTNDQWTALQEMLIRPKLVIGLERMPKTRPLYMFMRQRQIKSLPVGGYGAKSRKQISRHPRNG